VKIWRKETRTGSGAVLAAALLLTGCGRQSPVESGNRTGVFHYANATEPSDLDPHTNINGDTDTILDALFEGLVTLAGDGVTIRPGVAERWEVSPDGRTYTFHLRADARWSDGTPVTADDFLFSFRRIFDPALACEASTFGFAIAGAEAFASGRSVDPATLGLSAPDSRTFLIRLSHPAPYFLAQLGSGTPFKPVCRALVERFQGTHQRGTAWTRAGNLVSNGPFVLGAWTPDQLIVLRRNPRYWDAAQVALAELRVYPVADRAVQEYGFRAGQFHATTLFPVTREAAYRGKSPAVLRVAPLRRTQFLTFNVARPPFTDARVRRALSLAIDREKLVSAVFGRLAQPAHAFSRPGIGGYTPPASSACRLDPEEARRLLAAAGYPGGRGCPPLELMLVGTDATTVRLGEVVQADWAQVLGLRTELQPTEMKVYLDAERTKHFHVLLEGWGAPWDDPSAMYQLAQGGNLNNDSGWTDVRFDEAYRAAEASGIAAERTRAFERQESLLAEAVPYAPLYFANRACLVQPAVRGWQDNPADHVDWKEITLEP
jgi:oligopeptide transport system substrate-binding protein